MRHYVISIVLALAALAPHTLYAGALDRGPMQERYNPAAKDMLRVPGVVGSYEQEALGSLQQAGLAVTVKRITKDNPKYEGKEGIVISQVPSAGGVAMVGSSVNITVYKTGQGYQQGGFGDSTGGQWGDEGGFQDDGQQGYDEPVDGGQWGGDSDGGGWQPPPPREDLGRGMDEPSFEDDLDMNLGNDVPNVPPPSGSLRAPNLRRPVGKGGGIVGQPVTPSRMRVKPSATRDELMTPKQKRDLDRKIKDARSGKRIGIQPGQGTIVAKPVHTPVRRADSEEPNLNRSPRLPRIVPSKPIASPVPEEVTIKVRPGGSATSPERAVGKPTGGAGSHGIVVGTAKPKPVNRPGGQAIVVGTAKPKIPAANQDQQQLKKDETESGSKSWFQRLFK